MDLISKNFLEYTNSRNFLILFLKTKKSVLYSSRKVIENFGSLYSSYTIISLSFMMKFSIRLSAKRNEFFFLEEGFKEFKMKMKRLYSWISMSFINHELKEFNLVNFISFEIDSLRIIFFLEEIRRILKIISINIFYIFIFQEYWNLWFVSFKIINNSKGKYNPLI